MEKTGFVYIWYDRKRKMYYIGCHWGTEDDGYICSNNRMRDAYRRRPNDFRRRIIKTGIQRESLLEEEYKWLQLIPDDQIGKKYYNLRKHKWGHWTLIDNNELNIKEKMSISQKKRFENNIERDKSKLARFGRKHSEETRKIISNKLKGNKNKVGHIGPMKNKKHSEEARLKMSRKATGRKHSEETRLKMSIAQEKRWAVI